MLAWMLYVIMVTLLLSLGAYVAERAARLTRGRTRWIWLTAIVASLAIAHGDRLGLGRTTERDERQPSRRRWSCCARRRRRRSRPSCGSPAAPRAGGLARLRRAADNSVARRIRLRCCWRWSRAESTCSCASAAGASTTVSGAQVYVTEDVGPAVVGLLRPRIVVPRWVTMALPTHQAAVIAHEQSHLEARDPQLFTLALALLVFMPWNLPLWWQLRRLRYAIEVDCDARVLEGGIDPAHYGETLIAVGERQSAYVGAVAAMSESKSFLEERIEYMISKPVKWRRAAWPRSPAFRSASPRSPRRSAHRMRTVLRRCAGTAPAPERMAITLDNATLDRYVRYYKLGDTMVYCREARGRLACRRNSLASHSIEMYPESESKFFCKAIDAQLEFKADSGAGGGNAISHELCLARQHRMIAAVRHIGRVPARSRGADIAWNSTNASIEEPLSRPMQLQSLWRIGSRWEKLQRRCTNRRSAGLQ